MNINVTGMFIVLQAVAKKMAASGGGTIVEYGQRCRTGMYSCHGGIRLQQSSRTSHDGHNCKGTQSVCTTVPMQMGWPLTCVIRRILLPTESV